MDNLLIDLSMESLFGETRRVEHDSVNEMPGDHQMDIFVFNLGVGYIF